MVDRHPHKSSNSEWRCPRRDWKPFKIDAFLFSITWFHPHRYNCCGKVTRKGDKKRRPLLRIVYSVTDTRSVKASNILGWRLPIITDRGLSAMKNRPIIIIVGEIYAPPILDKQAINTEPRAKASLFEEHIFPNTSRATMDASNPAVSRRP